MFFVDVATVTAIAVFLALIFRNANLEGVVVHFPSILPVRGLIDRAEVGDMLSVGLVLSDGVVWSRCTHFPAKWYTSHVRQ